MLQLHTLITCIDSEEPTGATVVAMLDGQLVGSLGLRLKEPGGFVNSLYVLPEHQRRGIGEALLREAARLSQEHGKPTLGLSVYDDNNAARRLYCRLGFLPHAWGAQQGYTQHLAVLPLPAAAVVAAGRLGITSADVQRFGESVAADAAALRGAA